jgi:hypothetical protein
VIRVKKIAVYGSYEAKVPVRQRYHKWIFHRKGTKAGGRWYKKRVWKKTKRMKKVIVSSARYEFEGRGKDLYKAVFLAHQYMPKGFVDVSARKFVEHPEEYGFEGSWIDREVESR